MTRLVSFNNIIVKKLLIEFQILVDVLNGRCYYIKTVANKLIRLNEKKKVFVDITIEK